MASALKRALRRWNWRPVRASVEACEWMGPVGGPGVPLQPEGALATAGQYRVTYSYAVGEQAYQGSFVCDGVRELVPYYRTESLVVQRDPSDPARSHYQEDTITLRGPLAWLATLVGALVSGYLVLHQVLAR